VGRNIRIIFTDRNRSSQSVESLGSEIFATFSPVGILVSCSNYQIKIIDKLQVFGKEDGPKSKIDTQYVESFLRSFLTEYIF